MEELYENELYTRPFYTLFPTTSFPLHYHRHIELTCVAEGSIELRINDVKETLSAGDVAFILPYELHSYSTISEKKPVLFKAVMEPECIGIVGNDIIDARLYPSIYKAADFSGLLPDYLGMMKKLNEYASAEFDANMYCSQYTMLMKIIDTCFSLSELRQKSPSENSIFLKAVRVCYDSYTKADISTDAVANKLHISRSYLKQLFKKNMNMTLKEYIASLRIIKAEQYLLETNLSFSEIAAKCGYGTPRSLTRAFLKKHNLTPSEYRESRKNNHGNTAARNILSNYELFY